LRWFGELCRSGGDIGVALWCAQARSDKVGEAGRSWRRRVQDPKLQEKQLSGIGSKFVKGSNSPLLWTVE